MVRCLAALFLLVATTGDVSAQSAAKYGAEFLAGGVGGRALGMGGAHVALASDVSAGYWNAAGLHNLNYPQATFMHVERFAGVVTFDYGAAAFPVSAKSTVGISFFRSGVNDIKNTLDAWDPERDRPRPNPENYFTSFNAADYAFFVSYAQAVSPKLTVGVTGKALRRSIGDFADAWGYSFDLAAQYRTGRFVFGANIQDVSTMLQSWSVNEEAFEVTDPDGNPMSFAEAFDAEVPAGGTFRVLPVARLGTGVNVPIANDHAVNLGLDLDLAFDGQERYVFDGAGMSFHPRFGTEYVYRGIVALRAGVGRVLYDGDTFGLQMTPSVGAGLYLKQVQVDYGFGDFAGYTSDDLGYSHRISVQLTLEQPNLVRSSN